jgi:methylenetetrahydrofolate dehydrogenase (NADP+) / methenyltetrahydrofolate cyclohydrolase
VTIIAPHSAVLGEPAAAGPLILSGRPVAKAIREQCAKDIEALRGRYGILPGLTVVRVGEDPSSVQYADRIVQSFNNAGLKVDIVVLPAKAKQSMLQAELDVLGGLPEVAGIIVQMPLPPHLSLDAVIEVLNPDKDVDGIHPVNIGRLALGFDGFVPATPAGGMAILDHYGIPIEGKNALVIGRSGVVGKPLAQLLLSRNATVTIAHSRTRNLPQLIGQAEILASAVGNPAFVHGDQVAPGAIVLDFGAAVVDGQMMGDVHYDSALRRAGAITPVPGGTGPVTNAMLLQNTVKAMKRALS